MISLLIQSPVVYVYVIAIVIFSICIHELAHGLAAIDQGDRTPVATGHMTFNPVVHLGWHSILFLCIAGIAWGAMPVSPHKFRSAKWGNIIVSAAGPISNLALCMLAASLLKLSSLLSSSDIICYFSLAFYLTALINLKLFIFNLLPIPPLDGFEIFSEFFPEFKHLRNTAFGLFILMILFTTGFWNGFNEFAQQLLSLAIGMNLGAFCAG